MVADNSDKERSTVVGNFDMESFAHRVAGKYTAVVLHTELGNQAALNKEVEIDSLLAFGSRAQHGTGNRVDFEVRLSFECPVGQAQ